MAKRLGMPLETIYGFVEKKIKEQQAIDQGGYVPQEQEIDYESPYERQQEEINLRQREIDLEFQADPQLRQLRASFEGTNGTNSFMNQLYMEGRHLEESLGRDISVQEVTQSLKQKLSPYLNGTMPRNSQYLPAPAQPLNQPMQEPTANRGYNPMPNQRPGTVRQRKQMLPRTGGKTGISVRKRPKDLEELESMIQNNNTMMG